MTQQLEAGQTWVSDAGDELVVIEPINDEVAVVDMIKAVSEFMSVGKKYEFTVRGGNIKFKLKEPKMNKLDELQAKYEALGAEIKKLQEQEAAQQWPKVGDKYFSVSEFGHVTTNSFLDDDQDKAAKSTGNMFRTKEEAESELFTLKVIAKLRSQPGRKVFNANGINWCVAAEVARTVRASYFNNTDCGWSSTYFESEQAARDAIKAVGAENILKAARWRAMGEIVK